MEKNADALALILTCTTVADASMNYSRYVPQRPQSSHRPNGIFTCFALVLAGRWCLCREWHGKLRVVHHHWQHSYLRACSRSKVPIAPMETHVLLVFTGRRCLCLFRHRHNDVLLNHRQHSCWSGACSCSKLPIAPMGKLLTHLL